MGFRVDLGALALIACTGGSPSDTSRDDAPTTIKEGAPLDFEVLAEKAPYDYEMYGSCSEWKNCVDLQVDVLQSQEAFSEVKPEYDGRAVDFENELVLFPHTTCCSSTSYRLRTDRVLLDGTTLCVETALVDPGAYAFEPGRAGNLVAIERVEFTEVTGTLVVERLEDPE